MQRRNFLASLAALFAVGKLPEFQEKKTIHFNQKLDNLYTTNKSYFSGRYISREAGENIDVGALVYFNFYNGKIHECKTKEDKENSVGVVLQNNLPNSREVLIAVHSL